MMGGHKNQHNNMLTRRRWHLREIQEDFSVEFTVIMIIIWWLQQLWKDRH
jgi:hypothetical protein